ncbi:MAG: type IV secretion protein IcmX [Gammaproteobacteria bacterium]|nr:type IV secretion protein IcmX [Gammaproteobacteria bacterium]MCH9763578.1 type IV secretion protein IcmX [Gammaproteobacteria bacterium]
MYLLRHIVPSILLLISCQLHADTTSTMDSGDETLSEYLKNLGADFGFDVTQSVKDPVATLLDLSASTLAQQYAFVTLLGAIPVNAYSDAFAYFVPSDSSTYTAINDMANYTYQTQPNASSYNNTSTGESGGISVSSLIDQETYQKDPVSQAILNMLATPSVTYCLDNSVDAWLDSCSYLYNSKVASNVVGTLPDTDTFFTYDYNEKIIPQLNSNTLMAPLLYTTTTTDTSTSSTSGSSSDDDGLTAKNQAQEAQNFIRYAMQLVVPLSFVKRSDYSALYAQVTTTSTDTASLLAKGLAEEGIAKYISKLRSFIAQRSVAISNMVYIQSKRLPQAQSSSDSTQTSQALSEFEMATRRLYNPSKKDSGDTKQWIDNINDASTATVQKEMAILLSEMNYQMYLNRMQNERILSTLSVMLMSGLKEPDFSSDAFIDTSADDSNS